MNESTIPDYIKEVLEKIINTSKPVSIFLYGSMARGDFENDSDYEIGVVYKVEDKVSRSELKEINPYENIKIYPFGYEELTKGEIDTPFPKYIFLRTISESSIDLYGEKIKNVVFVPKICKADMFEAIGFCLGRAYSAVVSSRQNDLEAVIDGFTKSGLYGLQLLIIAKTRHFVSSYKELKEISKNLITDEFKELIGHIFKVRKGNAVVQIPLLYKNISFLNKVVLAAIKSSNIVI